jgi:bacterial/archaeal transporter family protein
MNWFFWALLSAFFAGITAILAKVGVENISSNLATAIRTIVILVFAWAVALATRHEPIASKKSHLALPHPVRSRHRTVLALLLSGVATWRSYASRAGR